MIFLNFILGLIFFIIGLLLIIKITNDRLKGDKGGYGVHAKFYTSGIGFIFLGLWMMIEQLMKLF